MAASTRNPPGSLPDWSDTVISGSIEDVRTRILFPSLLLPVVPTDGPENETHRIVDTANIQYVRERKITTSFPVTGTIEMEVILP